MNTIFKQNINNYSRKCPVLGCPHSRTFDRPGTCAWYWFLLVADKRLRWNENSHAAQQNLSKTIGRNSPLYHLLIHIKTLHYALHVDDSVPETHDAEEETDNQSHAQDTHHPQHMTCTSNIFSVSSPPTADDWYNKDTTPRKRIPA